jgi:predicted TPR repeat methyltransferase
LDDTAQLVDSLMNAGRWREAADALRTSVRRDRAQPAAWQNLAVALFYLGDPKEAALAARRAIELRAESPAAWNVLGAALAQLHRHKDAIDVFRRIIRMSPGHFPAHRNLASSLEMLGRISEAAAALRTAAKLSPEPAAVEFEAVALEGTSPAGTPAAYIRALFDAYAARYDSHMSGELRYQVPRLLGEALDRAGWPAKGRAVDLGCGTGLMASILRPHARELVGVDLSPPMIAAANRLQVYDRVVCQDLLAFLKAEPGPYDLLVAADVLVSFGDLDPLFAAVSGALAAVGRFAFSIEAMTEGDYCLRRTRRFTHGSAYVSQALARNGLGELEVSKGTLRLQGGEPVPGWIIVAGRREGSGR